MADKLYHVLFLSQRNAARSIMAEAILNSIGRSRFVARSAGIQPASEIEPIVLELLHHAQLPTEDLRPKHYCEFTSAGTTDLDFVFTLSDTAAGEQPPSWPGRPITAHWPSIDPTRFDREDTERRHALIRTRSELQRRLQLFVALPFASLDRLRAQQQVDDIGRAGPGEKTPPDGG
jgi:arsenate reductase (thioredoxin)